MTVRACRLAVLSLFVATVGCAHSPQHVEIPGSGATYEKEMLKWLVTYHQDQDRMTQPCAQKDDIRQELRSFCIETDRQHNERMDRMRTWLQNWYQTNLPRGEAYPLWVGSLKGQEFEREFLKEYLEHHAEGIEQTAKCASKAVHPELRELCARINPAQKKTGEQLKQWRCEWFRDCS